jgi:hypothetical protein
MKTILQSTDEFIDSINITEPRQREIAIAIRAAIAQQLGLSYDRVVASMEPNKMLKIAKKEWDDVDFVLCLEEQELFGENIGLIFYDYAPELFTGKFFGSVISSGATTVGDWVLYVTQLVENQAQLEKKFQKQTKMINLSVKKYYCLSFFGQCFCP